MTREVWLTITGVQEGPDGTEERNEIRVCAQCRQNETGYVLEYVEPRDDADGAFCVLTVEDDRIVLHRGNTVMDMAVGKDTECAYETPYGIIMMKIHTHRVTVKESVRAVYARAKYRLLMEPGIEVQSTVTVKIEPES